jgi:hypothetical protein
MHCGRRERLATSKWRTPANSRDGFSAQIKDVDPGKQNSAHAMSSSINTIWMERNEGLKRIASNTVSFFACSFKVVSGRRGEMRGSLFVGVAQTEASKRRQNKCQT